MRVGQTSLVHLSSRLVVTIVGFFGTWYFTQVVDPSIIGKYFLAIGVLAWLDTAGNLGVHTAITKRMSEGENTNEFFSAGLLLQSVLFVLVLTLLVVFWGSISEYLGLDNLALFAVLFIAKLGMEFVRSVLRGENKVHVSALMGSVDRVLRVGIQVGLILLSYELIGLMIGYAVAASVTAVVGILYVSAHVVVPDQDHLRSMIDFSKYSWLNSIRGRGFHAMDTIILGFFVASELLSVYEIAWNISTIFAIFGDSVQASFFPEMSGDAKNEARMARYTNDAITFAGLLMIPGVFGSLILGDAVLQVYGSFYATGYSVLIVLAVANLFNVYDSQFVMVLNSLDRPDLAYRAYATFLLTNMLLTPVLVWRFSLMGAAVGTTISTFLGMVVAYREVQKLLDISLPVGELAKQVFAAMVMAGVVVLIQQYIQSGILVTVGLVAVGATVYFVTLIASSRRIRGAISENTPITLDI